MNDKILISIIYVYFNTLSDLKNSLASIKMAVGQTFNYEIIVVDNNSNVKVTSELIKKYKIHLVKNKINSGYGVGLNIGVKLSEGKLLLFTNPDI